MVTGGFPLQRASNAVFGCVFIFQIKLCMHSPPKGQEICFFWRCLRCQPEQMASIRLCINDFIHRDVIMRCGKSWWCKLMRARCVLSFIGSAAVKIEAETKWLPCRRRPCPVHFLEWKASYFYSNFTEVCILGSCWQCVSIGSNNGLALARRQAIIINQRCPGSLTHICGTRGRWVNCL